MKTSSYNMREGIRDGIPIALGYLSVAFSFGLLAAKGGLSVLSSVLISMTNLTSAGQAAGLTVILTHGAFAEMALSQLTINIRYALMSLSLSQKLDDSFSTKHRLLTAFGITDEIFAVASAKKGCIGSRYMYGLILLPFIGWSLGTFLGAAAGQLLPAQIKAALGIALYGMFVAIVMPPMKKERGILLAVAISAILSCAVFYIPLLSAITPGFSIVICAVAGAVIASAVKPFKEEETI